MGIKRKLRVALYLLATFCFLTVALTPNMSAQSRISDKDVEGLMGNLKDDAKSFRPQFTAAIHKSSIRKTSKERDAKDLALRFEKETEAMLKQFQKTKKADAELPVVISTASQIDQLMAGLNLGPPSSASWSKIQAELRQVKSAFGMQPAATAQATPVGAEGGPSCYQGVGPERANRLVEECLKVSPSTHPVCNMQNPCPLIIDEIKRGCKLLKQDAPMFCNEYMN